MRRKDRIGPHFVDFGHHILNRRRRKRRLRPVARGPRHHHRGLLGKTARLKDLGPAIGKPSITDDQNPPLTELARHRFHRIGTAAGHQGHRGAVINLFEKPRDFAHHTLEFGRHVVQAAVGKNHRKLLQSLRVNMVMRQFHRALLLRLSSSLHGFHFDKISISDL